MTGKFLKVRRAIIPILSLVILTGLATGISAQTAQTYTATPSSDKTTLNGFPVTMQAYKINDNNYVKLRDFAKMVNGTALNFEVTWDGGLNAINIFTPRAYTPVGGEGTAVGTEVKQAKDTASTIYVNGSVVNLKGYNINNNNYFKLRDLGSVLGIGIDWDSNTKTIIVDSTGTGSADAQKPAALPTDGDRVVFRGTLHAYTYDEVVALQGMPDPNVPNPNDPSFTWSSTWYTEYTSTIFWILVPDTPQTVTLHESAGWGLSEGEMDMIVATGAPNLEYLKQYDGQQHVFSIDPDLSWWPSDTSLPLGRPATMGEIHVLQ